MLKTILLIDDDKVSNFITKRLLEQAFPMANVAVALNGISAYDYLTGYFHSHRSFPDLVLVDINMPVMDGFELLEKLKQNFPDPYKNSAFVLLTTSSHQKDIIRGVQLGIPCFQNKPLTKEKLQDIIQHYFSNLIDFNTLSI